MASDVLERWLEDVVATPGLTALRDLGRRAAGAARRRASRAPVVAASRGPIVDVGSGGGTPGIPLAAALPDRSVTLLEAERRKCEFLERWPGELPNVRVVWGRAEEQPAETFGVALAKALAKPPVACELCVPLRRRSVGSWCSGPGRPRTSSPWRSVAGLLGGRARERSTKGFS